MKSLLTLATTAALALGVAAPAFAQAQPTVCQAGHKSCKTTPQKTAKKAPKIGDSAKSGAAFQRAASSKVGAPPAGQEYRVVKDHLVLSDSKSHKIVRVVGPISGYAK